MATEIAPAQETLPANSGANQTMQLLQQAIQAGTSPEALEKLVALQERIMGREAEQQFNIAFAQFQRLCPAVTRTHQVKDRSGRVMYSYASLEDIVSQVGELLSDLGFSYSFDTAHNGNGVDVTCIIRHRGGHAQNNTVHIPATKGMNTNASQDAGIQIQYGMRYAFIGALGITTADEDKDGNAEKQLAHVTAQQAADLTALAEEVGADKAKFLKYLNVDAFASILARDYESAVAALESKRSHR